MELSSVGRRARRLIDALSRTVGIFIVFSLSSLLGGVLVDFVLTLVSPTFAETDLASSLALLPGVVLGVAVIVLPTILRSYRRTVSGPTSARDPYHHVRIIDSIGRPFAYLYVALPVAYLVALPGIALAEILGLSPLATFFLLVFGVPLAAFLGLSYWYYRKLY